MNRKSNTSSKKILISPRIFQPLLKKDKNCQSTGHSPRFLSRLEATGNLKSLPVLTPSLRVSNVNAITLSSKQLLPSQIYLDSHSFRSFGVSSFRGICRSYNEDRVVGMPNLAPNCHFFGLYDGHGGSKCSDFLAKSLHNYLLKQDLESPSEALKKAFEEAEHDFQEESGSCAIVLLIKNDICYVANVGDSRAVLSKNRGRSVIDMSIDHKPKAEEERILKAGGSIYSTMNGIYRVYPSNLSVSRSFGDRSYKDEDRGGNPNVVIATPDIKLFKINPGTDFIVLGCDGIFDVLSSQRVVHCVWENIGKQGLEKGCAKAAYGVIDLAMKRRSFDNVSAIVVAFNGFENEAIARQNNY